MIFLLVLTVIGFPIGAGLLSLVLRRWQGWIAVGGQLLGVVAALKLLWFALLGPVSFDVPLGIPNYAFQLLASRQSALIALTVAVTGLIVSVYGLGYMKGAAGQTRFWSTMSGFVAAMQLFVFAGDWLSLLIGWELMSLASFILIGFYNQRDDAVRAARRAFMTTRMGDTGLYLAALLLVSTAGNSSITATLSAASGNVVTLAALGLLLAGAVKAAQWPFDGWLRGAMAGPTPVSALLHSATMVAAGFLLLFKVSPLLTPRLSLLVALVGGITGVVAGIIAFAQTDLKRMLAASTSSQLGFMLLALGAGSPAAALLFFMAQATMKSSLFMATGVFQHAGGSTEFVDIRGLGRRHRAIFGGFVIAGLGLAAVPPLAGFFSKDAVIAATLNSSYRTALVPLVLVGALLTALYIAKAATLLAAGNKQGRAVPGLPLMTAGLLAGVSLVVILGDFTGLFEQYSNTQLPRSMFTLPIGLTVTAIGLVLGTLLTVQQIHRKRRSDRIATLAEHGFFGSQFLDKAASGMLNYGSNTIVALDDRVEGAVYRTGRGVTAAANYTEQQLERFFQNIVDGVAAQAKLFGERLRSLQSGLVHRELAVSFYMAGGLVLTGIVVLILKEISHV